MLICSEFDEANRLRRKQLKEEKLRNKMIKDNSEELFKALKSLTRNKVISDIVSLHDFAGRTDCVRKWNKAVKLVNKLDKKL